jgi:hypothetical protein
MSIEADVEIEAMGAISTLLAALPDDDARERVLAYVMARFAPDGAFSPKNAETEDGPLSGSADPEMAGVARLSDGTLVVTVRDFKAKSKLDAGYRIALVAIYAHKKLTGKPISSRKVLTPLLQKWRVYDGNLRTRIREDKGIIRKSDELSLDAHAEAAAEQFISEIHDPGTRGTWKPG